jgi:hypothetical protein
MSGYRSELYRLRWPVSSLSEQSWYGTRITRLPVRPQQTPRLTRLPVRPQQTPRLTRLPPSRPLWPQLAESSQTYQNVLRIAPIRCTPVLTRICAVMIGVQRVVAARDVVNPLVQLQPQ